MTASAQSQRYRVVRAGGSSSGGTDPGPPSAHPESEVLARRARGQRTEWLQRPGTHSGVGTRLPDRVV